MPDIRTQHPEIVRDLLSEGGFRCGVEPRVLEGRDPAWTCVVDGTGISGDLYIHQAEDAQGFVLSGGLVLAILALLVVVVICQAVAIVRLRRKAQPS